MHDATGVVPVRVCPGCQQKLDEVSEVMRRHSNDMREGLGLVRRGGFTAEQQQDFHARILASFNEARSAWDEYCDHLNEHGLVPSSK